MLQLNPNGAEFIKRHIGPNAQDTQKMLDTIGVKSIDELIEKTVPIIFVQKKQCKFQKVCLNLKCCNH